MTDYLRFFDGFTELGGIDVLDFPDYLLAPPRLKILETAHSIGISAMDKIPLLSKLVRLSIEINHIDRSTRFLTDILPFLKSEPDRLNIPCLQSLKISIKHFHYNLFLRTEELTLKHLPSLKQLDLEELKGAFELKNFPPSLQEISLSGSGLKFAK